MSTINTGNNVSPQVVEKRVTQNKDIPDRPTGLTEETTSPVVDDNVQLSTSADKLNQVKAKVDSTPEVDQEKIAKIRQAIANGEIKINPQNIAIQLINGN
jgi:negative regulator of flagellin synthesis FlgM